MTRFTATRTFMSHSGGSAAPGFRDCTMTRPIARESKRPVILRVQNMASPQPVNERGRGSAVGAGLPQHVGAAAVIDEAGEHEQMVGQPVDVFEASGLTD